MTFTAPRVLSKSLAKEMACHYRYLHVHCSPDALVPMSISEVGESGNAFHAYRRAYVEHLVEANYRRDPDWATAWLKSQTFSEDAVKLIEDDIRTFEVDPALVYGTELGLAVDRDLNPVEQQPNCDGPFRPKHAGAATSATIDLLLIDHKHARIVDMKSGYSTLNVHDSEPAFYAAVVFATFPYVESISFVWDFARVKMTKEISYQRSDLLALKAIIDRAHAKSQGIVDRANAGEPIEVNVHSGLCSFCPLACPAKTALSEPQLDVGPVQNIEDARRVAGIKYMAGILGAKAGEALKSYIDIHGPVDLPNDWVAEMQVTAIRKLPLIEALKVLGLDVLPTKWVEEWVEKRPALDGATPQYGIPIKDLILSRSPIAAKMRAKKRAGCEQAMDSISISTPMNKLAIHKKGEIEKGEE
ncbi:MAG: hypothetical protein KGL39_47145 [Patescibacteria group bacterium]|nr:hypothetical protein [Patescibacteria group bacterium]